jgi:hypothetical protein
LVKKKDRLNSTHVVAYLERLVETADRLKDPLGEIEGIFKKIEAWKDSYGDLEKQEDMIRERFNNSAKKIEIHNVKTLHE